MSSMFNVLSNYTLGAAASLATRLVAEGTSVASLGLAAFTLAKVVCSAAKALYAAGPKAAVTSAKEQLSAVAANQTFRAVASAAGLGVVALVAGRVVGQTPVAYSAAASLCGRALAVVMGR